jgi:hypothetical protein
VVGRHCIEPPPGFDDDPGLIEGVEYPAVQQFVARLPAPQATVWPPDELFIKKMARRPSLS